MDLIIDFDNTIVDSDKAIWSLYQKTTGDLSTHYTDHSAWWYDDVCPLWSREQQEDAFQSAEFFDNLTFMDGAKKYLEQLKADGHNLTVCTVHRGDGVPLKVQWIRKHLDFIDNLVIVESSSTGHKSMICGDILLDDNISNLQTSNVKLPIAFGGGKWNSDWEGFRASNWQSFYRMISGRAVN